MDKPECSHIYERLYAGQLDGHFAYKNETHGIMVLLDHEPIAEGHLVAATLACTDSVDHLPDILFQKLNAAARTAGLVLAAVYPDAPYIASIVAGRQIRHPHIHRVPGDVDADWAKRLGKHPDYPRFALSDEDAESVTKLVTTGTTVKALWGKLDHELDAIGPIDPLTRDSMQRSYPQS